jgi:ribonuclease HI
MEETISYMPRKAIKSQVLADFIAEWTDTQLPSAPIQAECWTMYFDGSLMKTGAGAGLLFISPLGVHTRYAIRLHFPASNNVAEYEALFNGLRIAINLGIRRLETRGDSQLVIDQVMKASACHNPKMEAYCQEVRKLEENFHGLEHRHTPRKYNEAADELAKIASTRAEVPPDILTQDLCVPSVKYEDTPSGAKAQGPSDSAPPEVMQADADQDWRIPLLNYLLIGELPEDDTEARRMARWAKNFVLIGNDQELYKRASSGVLQRCIHAQQGRNLLEETHAGECGHHAAPRTLVGKVFRQGFYWPSAVRDANNIVRACRGCQYYSRKTHLPAQALQTIPITWPFAVWGLDMIGPLPKAPGGFTHLLVAIDKFSKWIEARPVVNPRTEETVKLFTDIITRFGVPNSIITDNGQISLGRSSWTFVTTMALG